jgi:hypothetical protein
MSLITIRSVFEKGTLRGELFGSIVEFSHF